MKSAIYKITCLSNNKIYIGSALKLKYRINRHFLSLLRKEHPSPQLQAAYDKYGKSSFEVIGLEEYDYSTVTKEFLLGREQYYLDTLKPYIKKNGFNTCNIAGSPSRRHISKAHKDKIRKALKGRKRPKWIMDNLKLCNTGKKRPDMIKTIKKYKPWLKVKKQRGSSPRNFAFVDNNNNIFKGANLKKFSEEYGYKRQNLQALIRGDIKSAYGLKMYNSK